MIAYLIAERCTNCAACVAACPALVFDPGVAQPVVARADACETCYLCELACSEDALYVAPETDSHAAPPVTDLIAAGLVGQIRRDSGWNEPFDAGQLDDYRLLGPLLGAGVDIATRRYEARHARQA
jgi:NAD-dependent dihydropyrimidine dehydrogenase PreA subunit